MKNQILFLDEEEEIETLHLGLLRQVMDLPPHEFFFKINQETPFQFSREKDLEVVTSHFCHTHLVYETCDERLKNKLRFIKNQSSETKKIKEITELFVEEETENYLLPEKKDVNYIIKCSENIDFSVILLPKKLTFSIQSYTIDSDENLYQLIQYYE